MENTESVIKYSGVDLEFEKTILSGVNLDIKKGEFVYLIGKTGSGKSSLLKSIYADIRIEVGSAYVCGFTLNGLKKSKIPLLRRKLGIIFQDFQLLKDRSVYDNLAFVLKATGWKDKKAMNERILQALDDVGLLMKANEQACDLSEGEMQRVSIARAIVNQPELILADEPTGNLDPITSEEIVQLLMEINKKHGTTVLMATHDYIVLDKFRAKVIACEDGKIVSAFYLVNSTLLSGNQEKKVKYLYQNNWDKLVIKRGYIAVVGGILDKKQDTIRSYLKETK